MRSRGSTGTVSGIGLAQQGRHRDSERQEACAGVTRDYAQQGLRRGLRPRRKIQSSPPGGMEWTKQS